MSPPPTFAGIVLTGGLSRRMGTDKASLVVDGRRLVDRTIDALRAVAVDRVLVAGPAIIDLAPGVDSVPDPGARGQGPLAGIVSAWAVLCSEPVSYPLVVVLACDLPSLKPNTIEALLAAGSTTTHGAVAHDGERPQPLIAAYSRRALHELTVAFDGGETSVRRCFAGWELEIVSAEAETLADADTPSDLRDHRVAWPTESERWTSG